MNTKWLTTRSHQLQTPWNFGRHIKYIFSISIQNFSSIDDDHKELSPSKETDFKTKTKTLDAWISLNTNPNDIKIFSHIYSFMIYKTPKLQIQKCSNKGDMTKKPDLTQSFQKLITLTNHILFFWKFETRSILQSFIISLSFTPRSFHNRSRSRFKDLTPQPLICWSPLTSFLFFYFSSHFFLSSFLFCTWKTPMILLETLKL
jgi:hypothetical protein